MNLNNWLTTELQKDIWRNKYQHGDETFEEWLDRVSGGNKKIRQLIKDKKFLFGGRILANRGVNDRKSTYSNCYLIESPRDNLEEIFKKAYETAKTFSYGGGVGLNLSHLSPKGAKIHNAAETTSGAVSFMDLYNQTSALIGQNKRRGALMLCMNSDHPDIEEFIDVKKDLNKINKANTSVMMKPEFWYCYKSGKDYEAVYCRPESDQVIRKQINPDKFLTHVAQNNWETGEPGMLFSDNINDYNFMSNYYPEFFIEATNPCVTGDTMIATPDGDVPIEQLVGLQPDVYCLDSRGIVTIQKASRVWRTKQNAEIYEVDFGFKKIKCTGDHKFLVDSVITGRLEWIEAQNLLPETQLIGVVDAGKCHRYDCYYNVKSVTKLDETADVYDMTVENYHNFIGNNVVLHNCGEQPLIDYDSCLLGSMNLAEYVIEDEDNEPDFDYFSFANDVEEAIYALNEVQKEGTYRHPLDMQVDVAKKYRRVGLGIMGLADCLIKMGYEYSSKEARDFCSTVASTMLDSAVQASAYYAKEFGTFDGFDFDKISSSKFFKNTIFDDETISLVKEYGLYNSALLSIAPTGSISTMLGVSGGIEPIYDLSYTRKTESLNGKDTYYKVYTPIVEQYMKQHNIADESNLPDYFKTAKNIHWMDRLKMQAVWQEFIDAAISSTVNLPEETTVDEIKELYVQAHELGLKGVTVFRDNCFRAGILSSNDEPKDNASDDDKTKRLNTEEHKIKDVKPIDVKPENTVGKKRKLINGCVDGDTEYFNGTQWKKISEYQKGEKVLQYNKDGTASLVYPTDYIKRKSSGQYHIKTKYGLDMMVSPDHRNIVFDNKKDVNSFKIMTTNEIINEHNKLDNGFYKRFKTNFNYSGSGIDLTDDEIRIEVAIFADGCYYSPTSKKCMISVHKKRKRDRLIMLLERAGIEYSERINNRKYYDIKFYPPLKNREKQFPSEWYNCTQHQFQVIFDEVFKWDGYEKKNNQYSTVIKSNADFVQFVCTVTGHRSTINVDIRKRRPTHQTAYRVDWNNKVYCSLIHRDKNEFKLIQPKDGYDYCFSVPSTMLVLRRNNRIFVTGNCGSLHVLAYFDKETGRLLEVFLGKGSAGGCQGYMTGLARMISLAARSGCDISEIVDQLHSVPACPSYVGRFVRSHDTSKGSNCPGAIGYALVDMFLEMQSEIDRGLYDDKFDIDSPIEDEIKKVESVVKKKDKPVNDYVPEDIRCPECGDTLVRASGCLECKSCGWSKCN